MIPANRPLLLTDDPDLLDELVRLASAGGVEVEVSAEPGAAWQAWTSAPLVVASSRLGPALRRARLPRRPGLILVGEDSGDPEVWTLAQALDAEHVVFLPAAQRWLVDRFAASLGGGTAAAPLVSVIGGRGGAGASVLAVGLALAEVRRGGRVVLVDADPLGGGLDLVLGAEDAGGVRWPDLAETTGRLAGAALCTALPRVADVSLLTWDRGDPVQVREGAMSAVLGAARLGAGLVVADLPRWLDAAAVQALQESDVALLVLPAEIRACAAAALVATSALAHCSDLRVVVRGPAPAGLSSRDVAAALGLPLAGVLRPEPGLARDLERGGLLSLQRRGPLSTFCRGFLDELTDQRVAGRPGPAAA